MVNRFVMLLASLLIIVSLGFIFGQRTSAQAVDDLTPSPSGVHYLQETQTISIEFGGAVGTVYRPAEVRISPGDSIEWLGDFAMHPLVSDDGLWQTVSSGTQFTKTYDQPGVYPYHCQVHDALGMNGTIIVGYYGYLPLITR
jgi:plastocyanin